MKGKMRQLLPALSAALALAALVGIGVQVTVFPGFAAAGCGQARVTIYEGKEEAGMVTLLIRNEGARTLALEKYATSPSGRVERLPGTIYLSPGGAGTFSFAAEGRPAEVTVTDRECRRASDLWVFK